MASLIFKPAPYKRVFLENFANKVPNLTERKKPALQKSGFFYPVVEIQGIS